MKKILILVTAMLVGIALTAQENKVQKEPKSYLVLGIGPSFPVSDFASANEENEKAGFAETGLNIDLTYGYKFMPYLSLEASALFNFNGIDKKILQGETSATVDHFQVISFLVGPAFSNPLSDNVDFGFRIRGGYASVNSPKLKYAGETLVTEDWAGDLIWGGGFNMKFNAGKKTFIAFDVDYLQTKPEFKIEALGESISAKQTVTVLNLNVGFGLRF
jgi:Outer membrane protein beta-barrel domain